MNHFGLNNKLLDVQYNNPCRSSYIPDDGPVWPWAKWGPYQQSVKLHWRQYFVCVSSDQLIQQDA